jgi:beta-lactamase superfamily II metal-dependent hydrolase
VRAWCSFLILAMGCGSPATEGCGGGGWRPGWLEIHHLALGQADATLMVGPTGRTLLVDAGEVRWDDDAGARTTAAHLREMLGCAHLDQVLLTHFHVDHVGYPGKGGLWRLVEGEGFTVGKLLHRDTDAFRGDSGGTIDRWRDYLAGPGRRLHPEVAREGRGQLELGPGVDVRVVAVDGHGVLRAGDYRQDRAPPNENDYSVAAVLRFGAFDYFIGGDLSGEWSASPFGYAYHDVETAVARGLPDVDVYRVDHHGSDHSSNPTLLAQLDPEVSIVSVGEGNPFGHPRPETVTRLAATGVLYLTQHGHVIVRTDGRTYTVAGDSFVATDPARVDTDGDGYFREADPDDRAPEVGPAPRGGCDPVYQACSVSRPFPPMLSSVPDAGR